MSDLTLTPEQREAITHHLLATVVPILDQESGEGGCGILFRRGDQSYLVSATHVLNGLRRGSSKALLMLERPPNEKRPASYVPLGPGEFVGIEAKTRPIGDDDYGEDVAAYRLRDDVASRFMSNGWVFATESDVHKGPEFGQCLIFGWPSALMEGKRDLEAQPVCIQANTIPPPPHARLPVQREFFTDFPERAPALYGVSGAPVWAAVAVEPGSVWLPSQQFKLVGVQHAMCEDKTYIRATQWCVVAEMLDYLEAGLIAER